MQEALKSFKDSWKCFILVPNDGKLISPRTENSNGWEHEGDASEEISPVLRFSNHEISCINKEAVIETLGLQLHGCQVS